MRDTDSEAVSGIIVCRIVVAHIALVEAVWSVRDAGAIQAARAVTAADTAPVHHRTPTPLAGAVSHAVVGRVVVTYVAAIELTCAAWDACAIGARRAIPFADSTGVQRCGAIPHAKTVLLAVVVWIAVADPTTVLGVRRNTRYRASQKALARALVAAKVGQLTTGRAPPSWPTTGSTAGTGSCGVARASGAEEIRRAL